MRTRLKVCCISSIVEARIAIAAGADALGLVAQMPTGPGPICDALIREIALATPAGISTFLLTSLDAPEQIVEHVRATAVNTVQLVDDTLGEDVWSALRAACPAIRIVQVIHVRGEASVGRALAAAQHVDSLLLDSGNPGVRELGGTGRVHDWSVSRRIVERSSVPVFLAGGMTPLNVSEAIRTVRPFGIDLCSGVRTNGALDVNKLAALVRAMRDGDAAALSQPGEIAAKITLRPTRASDLPSLHAFETDAASNALAGTKSRDWPTFEARWKQILADTSGSTGVTPRVIVLDGQVVGAVNISPSEGRHALGYWIAREQWGRGIASRAVGLMLAEFTPRPIYATAAATNLPSIRVLEKNGFRMVSRVRTPETARTIERETVTFVLG